MTPQEQNNQPTDASEDSGSSFFARITEKLRNQVDLACKTCNEPFRGDPDGDGLCSRCSHYASVPSDAPGAFNWFQKHNNGAWTVRALWEDYRYVGDGRREDIPMEMPAAGDAINVYRRDGTSSRQTISKVGESFMAPNGCRYLYCEISPDGR